MQFNSETFKIISNNHCHHPLSMKSGDDWKSPVKIMLLNVSFICCGGGGCGINNLWNQKSSSSRANMIGVWISLSLLMCLLAAMPIAEARPASVSRAMRDQTRHFFLSSSSFSNGSGNLVPQKSFSADTNTGAETLSLSIFSPLDILRQNMLLEIQRKRLRHAKHQQMQLNKEFLDRIG